MQGKLIPAFVHALWLMAWPGYKLKHTHTPHTHTHALKHTLKYTLAITGCGYASAGKFKFNNCRTLYNSMEEEKDGQQGVGGKGRGRR